MMSSKVRARPMTKSSFVARIASGLSFVAAIIVSGILSYFIDALNRGYRSVPWPIVVVMAASCLNIVGIFFTTVLRCLAPGFFLLLFLIHFVVAVLWLVSTALLGRELDDHLRAKCPTSSEMGHDISLVCHLFKTLFAFSVTATFFSFVVTSFDLRSWIQSRKSMYTAMEKNAGGMAPPTTSKPKRKTGIMARLFPEKNKSMHDDERSVMLDNMGPRYMQRKDDTLFPEEGQSQEPMRIDMPSLDIGPRQRTQVGMHKSQFDGQETRYDPGGRPL